MNAWQKIVLWANRGADRVTAVSPAEKLEAALSSRKRALEQIRENCYHASGRSRYYENQVKLLQRRIEILNSSARECKRRGEEERLEQILCQHQRAERRLEIFSQCTRQQAEITGQLERSRLEIERDVDKMQAQLDVLRTRSEFAQGLRQYRKAAVRLREDSWEETAHRIEIDYSTGEAQLDDLCARRQENAGEAERREQFAQFVESLG